MARINHLFFHRCRLERPTKILADGMVTYIYTTVPGHDSVPCRLDLGASDAQWSENAGRAPDRAGVLFLDPKIDAQVGDMVTMTKGKTGKFSIRRIDRPDNLVAENHLECTVDEEAQSA